MKYLRKNSNIRKNKRKDWCQSQSFFYSFLWDWDIMMEKMLEKRQGDQFNGRETVGKTFTYKNNRA